LHRTTSDSGAGAFGINNDFVDPVGFVCHLARGHKYARQYFKRLACSAQSPFIVSLGKKNGRLGSKMRPLFKRYRFGPEDFAGPSGIVMIAGRKEGLFDIDC
jgi:hypothetical protein